MREKRLATILYADLTGFTQLTASLGAEKIAEFVSDCFKEIDEIVHRYKGTVIRHEGDRVMAVFGVPKSHGNDSYCALISGLNIVNEAKKFPREIGVHIGIATGEIVYEDQNIFGYVTETASQLEGLAPTNGIYVDYNCYLLNRFLFEFKEVEHQSISCYQLIGERRRYKEYENIFVNRAREITNLTEALDKKPHVIFVNGDAGIGKTRLISEAIDNSPINQQAKYLTTSFLSMSQWQFYESIIKMMRELNPDLTIGKSKDLLSDDYLTKLHNEYYESIIAASQKNPLILHFQYFDRADQQSYRFIKFIINNLEKYQIAMILEMQKSVPSMIEELRNIAADLTKIISLSPLDNNSQIAIAKEILGLEEIPNDLEEKIIYYSNGNPLYLTELCNYIKDQLQREKAFSHIKVPYRVKETINEIIDNIPNSILDCLQIGAIYGYTMNRKFMELASPDFGNTLEYCLAHGLLETQDGEIIFRNPFLREELCSRIPKKSRQDMHRKIATILRDNFSDYETDQKLAYHFKESQENELALHYTLKWAKRLKEMHANEAALIAYNDAVALAQQISSKSEVTIRLERLGIIHILGDRKTEELELQELLNIAGDQLSNNIKHDIQLRHGAFLESISRYDEALVIYQQCLLKERSTRILERVGTMQYHQNDFSSALTVLNEALNSARRHNEQQKEGDILRTIALVYWKMGDKERSLEHSQRALNIYKSIDDEVSAARVTANMANVYYYLSQFEDALSAYEHALEVATRIGDVVFQSRMITNIGSVYGVLGEYERSLHYYKKALKIDQRIIHKRGEAIVLNNIGDFYGTVGKYKEALEYFEKALAISEEINDTPGISIRLGNIGNCYAGLGQTAKAIEYLQKAVALSTDLKMGDWIAYYNNDQAKILMEVGRYNEALKFAREATTFAHNSKNISYEVIGLSIQARVYEKLGDLRKALKLSRDAVMIIDKIGRIEGSNSDIYYNHYCILMATNNEKDSYEYLEKAYVDIRSRGDRIKDHNLQKSFFENIKENREVIELWQALKKRK